MKPIHFLPFLSLLLLLAPSSGSAAGSMLRIACDGSNKGADVEVNGKFKGQCPLDLQVPEGVVKLKVWKAVDELEERVYEEEMRIGDGVVKKVDVELEPAQLSDKARKYIRRYDEAKSHNIEELALTGDPKAMMEIAKRYRTGVDKRLGKDREKYVLWLRKAADAGYPKAMSELSESYAFGKNGFSKSVEQSQAWLFRAAEAGDSSAMLSLAFGYSTGEVYGLKVDKAKADDWSRKEFKALLKEQAEAGDPSTMKIVGNRYYMGSHLFEVNRDEGRKWLQRSAAAYRKLADAGDTYAMRSLSEADIDENGEKMTPEQKLYWSKLAEARSSWTPFKEFKELREFVRRTEGASK